MEFLSKLAFNLDHKNPELFVASQWQDDKKTPNLKYLLYRWIAASYFAFTVILSIITATGCQQLQWYLIYLTNWNVLINAAQSLLAAYIATCFYRKTITFDNDLNSMSLIFKIFWALSSISIVVAVSLSVIYWPIIYTGRDEGLNDKLTHAGNAIILTIDLFINAHPARFSHMVYPIALGFSYICFSMVYTLLGGVDRDYENYIYSIIDWSQKPMSACLVSLAIIIFAAFMHVVLTALVRLRTFIYQQLHNNRNVTSTVAHSENLAYDA